MLLDWIILAATFALQLILIPKPQTKKPAALEDFDVPVCEEGKEFGVLSGTEILRGPNVTWWGDLKITPIKGPRRYGFFGPRSTIGYQYSLGMQMTLCHGPADKIYQIIIGDKLAWEGEATGGSIFIFQPNLFGGEEREGGIVGWVDICMGAPNQARNDYLAQAHVLGADCSAFRGVVTIVLRQVYVGTNTYIKPWAFKLKRIHKKSNNTEQWYDEKAEVPDSHTVFGTEPGVQLFAGETMNAEMKVDANFGYASRVDEGDNDGGIVGGVSGSLRVWKLPEGTMQYYTPPNLGSGSIWGVGYNLFGSCSYITDFGEVVLHYSGNIWGSAPTYLYFADVTEIANQTQGMLDVNAELIAQGVPGNVNVNFGFCCAQRGNTMLIRFWPHFQTRPYMLLSRSSGAWVVVDAFNETASTTIDSVTSISLGPTYAYGLTGYWSVSGIRRINYSTWDIDDVDLAALGMTGTAAAISYVEGNNEVLVVTDTGVFIFDASLTVLKRSKTDFPTPVNTAAADSRRLFVTDNTFAIDSSNNVTYHWLYEVDVNSLEIVNQTNMRTSNYVNKTNTPDHLMYDTTSGGFVAARHFLMPMSYWPYAPPENWDMNPAHIIKEYLTDPFWGMGYHDTDIDLTAFTSAADTYWNENFGLTIFWVKQEKVEEMVNIILSHTSSVMYLSRRSGKYVLKPIRLDYSLGSIPIIDEDDVLEWGIKRRQPADAITSITVDFTNRRTNDSRPGIATYHNDAMINMRGGVVSDNRKYPGISRFNLAQRVALRDQKPFNAGMIDGNLVCKRTIENLNPGDPFRLTSSKRNLNGEVMRVMGIKFREQTDNAIDLQIIQDVFRLSADDILDESHTWERPTNAPQVVNPRLVWEPPYSELVRLLGAAEVAARLTLDDGSSVLQIAGEQPTGDTLDLKIYVDGVQASEIVDSFSPSGFLDGGISTLQTAITITSANNLDLLTAGMLGVILEPTTGTVEIVQYVSHAGNNLVINRGMLDTVPRPHSSGVGIIFFDDFATSDFVPRDEASSPSVRLLSHTLTGTLVFSAAPADIVDFDKRAIRPLRPANVKVEGFNEGPVDGTGLSEFVVTWSERNRLTETSTFLEWDDSTVAAEAGQTTIIEVVAADGTTVLTTHSGLSGTSFNVPLASFDGDSLGFIRVGAERDGYREWQAYMIEILVDVEGLDLDGEVLDLNGETLVFGD